MEARAFFSQPLTQAQSSRPNLSVMAQPAYSLAVAADVAFGITALVRVDRNDPDRTHFDAREAYVRVDRGRVTARLGYYTVFWGVTESRHLVNVVNQSDFLEDLDGDEKLGQLMAMLTHDMGDLGYLDVFLMTWSRPQVYPGTQGRPGVPVRVEYGQGVYEARNGRWHPDVAMRWSQSVAGLDWAISAFAGTARDPELMPRGEAANAVLVPRYELIRQTGLELQWTRGAWLWKAEGLVRAGQGPLFAAVTAGFEHVRSGIFRSAVDVGVMFEYSYDGRDNQTFNIHDDDVFGGLRVSFNDVPGSEVVTGVLRDLGSDDTYATVEASRRLGERWRLRVLGRAFGASDDEDPLYWFRRDDYLQATLEFHF